jgi:hypothetical protein
MTANAEPHRPTPGSILLGVLGGLLLGLFLALFLVEAFMALVFGHGPALAAMLAGYAAVWWATQRLAPVTARIAIRACVTAVLFCPFVPTPGIEWSSPWPPAAYWLLTSGFRTTGSQLGWMVLLALVLWWAGWEIHITLLRRFPGRMTKPGSCNRAPPEAPLSWPDHFPPTDRWKIFFTGIRLLGPDVSFFEELKQQQAVRTESLMIAWTDPQQRGIALAVGRCLQRELEWKTPWFIPTDATLAAMAGPSFDTWNELDPWDLFIALDEQVGTKRGPEFWSSLVNWDDKHQPLSEVVGKLAEVSLNH